MITAPIFPVSHINIAFKPGIPCFHTACLWHHKHPCEGCGRIAGGLPELDPKPTIVVCESISISDTICMLRDSVLAVLPEDYSAEYSRRFNILGCSSYQDFLDLSAIYVNIRKGE